MQVLVTGGAGYIGSHTVVQLATAGHSVAVLDDFSNSSTAVIPRLRELVEQDLPVYRVDLTDPDATAEVLAAAAFDTVIHFAGFKAVGESVQQPIRYYRNNLDSTLSLVGAMQRAGVRRLVFSSSATVYGPNPPIPVAEDAPVSATNPYGWSKVIVERILTDLAASDPAWSVALLRYFNPGGAHPSGLIGEDPTGVPNNLLPYIAQVAVGRLDHLRIHGGDYDTVDGTGVRDYIHVEDLAAGHVSALEHLASAGPGVRAWNLGTGRGTSVLELVRAFEAASGRKVPYEIGPRRPGDVSVCYADPGRANRELGWTASRTTEDICADAWRWQSRNPFGFGG